MYLTSVLKMHKSDVSCRDFYRFVENYLFLEIIRNFENHTHYCGILVKLV